MRIIKWLFASLAVLLLVAVIGGRFYQVTSEQADLARFPPPGNMVDVDGHRMHIHCQGKGSPTVVVEQGLQSVSSSWEEITRQIAPVTRVCAYDRVGLGYSEPIGHATRSTEVAELLHKLLRGARIEDDLVLVGWSAGGVYIREYRRLHPEKVRAMLFVESAHEQQQLRLPRSPAGGSNATLEIAKYLAPIGLVRLSGIVRRQIEQSPAPAGLKPRLVALYERSHVIEAMLNESKAFTLDTESKQPPASLGDLPLIVLTAGKPQETAGPRETPEFARETQKVREELQQELVALSTTGKRIVATESGHSIHYDQPELLIASVHALVKHVRDQGRPDE